MDFILQYLFEIGCAILILFALFDRNTVRVDWGALSKFQAFLVMLTLFRIAQFSFAYESGAGIPGMGPIGQISPWQFFLVFWEDAFYVLPMVFLRKFKWTSKWYIWYPIFIAMSAWFGHGHLYQGLYAAVVISLAPYFLSYRYGSKFGFGTIMLSHICYDFVTFYTIKLLPLFL